MELVVVFSIGRPVHGFDQRICDFRQILERCFVFDQPPARCDLGKGQIAELFFPFDRNLRGYGTNQRILLRSSARIDRAR